MASPDSVRRMAAPQAAHVVRAVMAAMEQQKLGCASRQRDDDHGAMWRLLADRMAVPGAEKGPARGPVRQRPMEAGRSSALLTLN